MKKLNKKPLILLICAALLLTFTVSGTVAYLVDASGSVENQFKPATVDTEITEEVESGTKRVIKITNTQDSIDVYVRVAIIGNWVITENNVDTVVGAWSPVEDQYNSTDWFTDGSYFYYEYVVAPGGSTSDLLATDINAETRADGAHLEITVVHQSIQAQPKDAVSTAWGADVATKLQNTYATTID